MQSSDIVSYRHAVVVEDDIDICLIGADVVQSFIDDAACERAISYDSRNVIVIPRKVSGRSHAIRGAD